MSESTELNEKVEITLENNTAISIVINKVFDDDWISRLEKAFGDALLYEGFSRTSTVRLEDGMVIMHYYQFARAA